MKQHEESGTHEHAARERVALGHDSRERHDEQS
jgi:hypothetical protein